MISFLRLRAGKIRMLCGTDLATVNNFFSAINRSLTFIRDFLSATRQPVRLP
jgi:hypothetical protein